MTYQYDFKIHKGNEWLYPKYPPKLINLKLHKNKFYVDNIIVFLGNYTIPSDITKILNNISKNKLTSIEQNKLKEYFGNEWKRKIGLDIFSTELKGGKLNKFKDDIQDIDFGEMSSIKLSKHIFPNTNIIQYNYDHYISLDDTIHEIKDKFELASQFPSSIRHIFLKGDNNIFIPLIYNVHIINKLSTNYTLDLYNLFQTKNKRNILNIPIDNEFYTMYMNKNIKIINNNYRIYYEFIDEYFKTDDNAYTFYSCNINDICYQKIDVSIYDSISEPDFDLFYKGFLLKYFPQITTKQMFSNIVNGSINKYKMKDSKEKEKKFKYNYQLQKTINNVSINDIKNVFNFKESILLMISVIDNKIFNYIDNNIIDLRNLFELISTDDFIIYMEYRLTDNKRVTKINKDYEGYIMNSIKKKIEKKSIKTNADFGETNTLKFKIKRLLTPEVETNRDIAGKLINIDLNRRGTLTVIVTWEENDYSKFKNFIEEIIPSINKFVDIINTFGKSVFPTGLQLRHVSPHNIFVRFMNMTLFYQLTNSSEKNLDTFYLNPVKLPALISLFNSYFNPKMVNTKKSIHEKHITTISRIHRIDYYKTFSRGVINELTKEARTNDKFVKIKFIEKENKGLKIVVNGIRNIGAIDYIYNFITRFMYLYRQYNMGLFDEYPDLLRMYEKKFTKINSEILKTSLPYSKRTRNDIPTMDTISDFILNNKEFSKIKLLKDTDPALFDYDTNLIKSKTIRPYSRVCQSNQQPIPMNDIELEKIKKKYKNMNYLEYINKTDGTKINYGCLDKTHQYPGFHSKNEHPKGYCLVCCRKMNYLQKQGRAYKKFLECLNEKPMELSSMSSRTVRNNRYIKAYGKLEDDRYGWLPNDLMDLFNSNWKNVKMIGGNQLNTAICHHMQGGDIISNCNKRKIRLLDEKALNECYLLYGIFQSTKSLLTAVEKALDMKYGTLLNILIENLKKHPAKFDLLEGGNIKVQFETIDNYISFMIDKKNILTEDYIDDLIKFFNPIYPNNLNIIIFDDIIKNNTGIVLKNKSTPTIFLNGLNNPKRKNIIIVKKVFNYYLFVNDNKFIYDYNDKSINIIKIILNINLQDDYAQLKPLPEEEFSLIQFIHIFKEYNFANYKIISQYITDYNNNNTTIYIGIQDITIDKDNIILFPIKPSSSTNITIEKHYIKTSFDTVLKFIKYFYETIYSITVLKINIFINGNNVVALQLLNGRNIYINDYPIDNVPKNIIKNKFIIHYTIDDINNRIIDKKNEIDNRIKNSNIINYTNEINNIIILELNNVLFDEKNNYLRKKILDIVNNIFNSIKNYEAYSYIDDILDKIKSISKEENFLDDYYEYINDSDLSTISQLLNIARYKFLYEKENNLISLFETIFMEQSFDFDLFHIKKLKELLMYYSNKLYNSNINNNRLSKEYILNKIKEILVYYLNKILIIGEEQSNEPSKNNNIINLCQNIKNKRECKKISIIDKQQCIWAENNNDGCKILINKKNYDYHLTRIYQELLKNDIIKSNLLDKRLSNIKNYIFSQHDTAKEKIKIFKWK